MVFKAGVKEAAKMLSGLDFENRERVLGIIAKQDPQMAEILKKYMVTLEDLQLLTVSMMQELLKEIDINKLGLALRIGTQELRSHFLNNVSSTIRKDIEDVLNGPPRPVSEVQQAAESILEVVRVKVDKGEIVLKSDDEVLV